LPPFRGTRLGALVFPLTERSALAEWVGRRLTDPQNSDE